MPPRSSPTITEPAPFRLLDLPPKLVENVVRATDRPTCSRLALACQAVSEMAMSILYEDPTSLPIDSTRSSDERVPRVMATLEARPSLKRFVKRLSVQFDTGSKHRQSGDFDALLEERLRVQWDVLTSE